MKIKNIKIGITTLILGATLASCNSDNSSEKFDQNPTERFEKQKLEMETLLRDSEYGWKTVYFTDDKMLGGFTFLFDFLDAENVVMASDFDEDTKAHSSLYNSQFGSTVSVVFTTKNKIHLLSDSNNYPIPSLRGKGYKGDFQFLYYGQDKATGDLLFRSNRLLDVKMRFVKATAQDWKELDLRRSMIKTASGEVGKPRFRVLDVTSGGTTASYDFSFNEATRFASIVGNGEPFNNNNGVGVGLLPNGIVVSPAIKVGEEEVTELIYDKVTSVFKAETASGNVVIRYSDSPAPNREYAAFLPGNKPRGMGYLVDFLKDAPANSTFFKTLVESTSVKVSNIQFSYNEDKTDVNYIFYVTSAGNFRHDVKVSEGDSKLILTDAGWRGGTAPAVIKEIDKYLVNPKGIYIKKEGYKFGPYPNQIITYVAADKNPSQGVLAFSTYLF